MELIPFTYGDAQVRVVQIDDEPWFVLSDLCKVLGISNVGNVTARLDEAGVRQADIRSGGQMRSVTIVNEPGMYEVVIRSDKSEAVTFRRWITGEVLPQIRKTGSYGVAKELTGPELMAKALIEANTTMQAQQERIAQLEPSAAAWTHLSDSSGDYSVGDAAKVLSRDPSITTGQNRLFKRLADLGWIFRSNAYKGGGWRAYQSRVDSGHLVEKIPPIVHHPETGEPIMKPPQIRVTAKGLGALHAALGGTANIDDLTAVQSTLVEPVSV